MMKFSRLSIGNSVCLTYLALGVDIRIESSAATVGRDGAYSGRCHRIFYKTVRVFFFCSYIARLTPHTWSKLDCELSPVLVPGFHRPIDQTDLEEAILIRRRSRPDDESATISHVGILEGDSQSLKRH